MRVNKIGSRFTKSQLGFLTLDWCFLRSNNHPQKDQEARTRVPGKKPNSFQLGVEYYVQTVPNREENKSVKGQMVYNGKPTREWLTREDSASPTAALESIMLTAVIDAHEGRDVMCADIPNAFIQAEMPDISDGEERVTMKITGVLVDMLVQLSPEI